MPDLTPAAVAADLICLSATVTSDATGEIGYGGTAPSGTDQTSAVQAVIDAAPAGGIVIWDVAVGLSAPILLPSNITIWAPGRECGAILRAAANCPMFRNVGITTDGTTSKQKTFGLLDADHAGNAAYRVLDLTSINDENITIIGGTWNGNAAAQTGHPFTATYGFLSIFQFWGVQHVLMRDVSILRPWSALPIHFCNWFDVTLENCIADMSPIDATATGGETTTACFQFNGPGQYAVVTNPITHADDDHLAFNADDSNASAINSTYAGSSSVCTPGVNWVQCGDIRHVRVTNHQITNGIEDVVSSACVRLLTTVHAIDDLVIDGQHGTTSKFAYTIGAISNTQIDGVGNLGRVDIIDSSIELTSPDNDSHGVGAGVFDIRSSALLFRILRRHRGNIPASGVPDVSVKNPSTGNATIRRLVLDGDYYDTSGSGDVAAAQIKCASSINEIEVTTHSSRVTNSAVASPVLLTATGCAVDYVDFRGYLSHAANVVTHAAGAVTNIRMAGSHSNAAGGSPLDIANGLTLTNGWYVDLAFVAANGFKSGSGTVTHTNDWSV